VKQAFLEQLARQNGLGPSTSAEVAGAASSSAGGAAAAEGDPELLASLRLIAELERRESAVKSESASSAVAVKSESSPPRIVKREVPDPEDQDENMVDLTADSPPPVKSEPVDHAVPAKAEEAVRVKAEAAAEAVKPDVVKSEPVVKAEPAPYVSAASLISDSFSADDLRPPPVKTEMPAFTRPVTKQAAPTPSPPPRAITAAATATAAAPSPSPSFREPVKPSSNGAGSMSGATGGAGAGAGSSFRPLSKHNIHVILSGKQALMGPASSQTRVVIISYDLVPKYTLALQRQNFQFIICDESHYVKNASAKRSQALLPLMESAKRLLCLSGTPAMSRPYELWPQINALRPTVFGSAHQFGTRYCEPRKGYRGRIEYKGATNLVELHLLLKRYVLIRRLKADVLKDLRPKTRTVIVTSVHDKPLADNIRNIANIKQLVAAQIDTSAASAGGGAAAIAAAAAAAAASSGRDGPKKRITELFADTGKAKLPFIVSYISDLLAASSGKFLVFAHHLMVLDGIEACLKKEKAGYFRLDGSTPPAVRQEGVERFQTDPECRVALLSITAGGTGITLTAASLVVFAELQWTPALLCQAEDRVHRIGQFNPVNCHYIVAHHSLDEILWPLLSSKLEVLGNTLDGREDALRVVGVQGAAAKNTPILFKKDDAALRGSAVDLTQQDHDDDEDEETESKSAAPFRAATGSTGVQQQRSASVTPGSAAAASASSSGAVLRASGQRSDLSAPAAPAASAARPFTGWIGMNKGGVGSSSAAAAAAPPSLAPGSGSSSASGNRGGGVSSSPASSVARLVARDASLAAEFQSTQQARRVAQSAADDVARYRLPSQPAERATAPSPSPPSVSLLDAAALASQPPYPPSDAEIALDESDVDDDDYASS